MLDPKDKTYYSYYLTRDKKYFQLMAFLEEEDNLQTAGIIKDIKAVDYSIRYPTVFGAKLGILTDINNTPIQEIQTIINSGSLDIANVLSLELKSFLKDDELVSGTGTTFSILKDIADKGGRGYSSSGGVIVYVNLDSNIIVGPGWSLVDINCDKNDILVGDQVWVGCNSTLGTGIEYGEDSVSSCYDYEGTNGATLCNLPSNTKENSWNSTYGVDNIWGKLYNWANASTACSNGYRLPTSSEISLLTGKKREELLLPLAGHTSANNSNLFSNRGESLHTWSSDAFDSTDAYLIEVDCYNSNIVLSHLAKTRYLSVRCIAVYTEKADRNLTYPYRTNLDDINYGKILKHSVRGFALTYYTGHSCDNADGIVRPYYLEGNRFGAWRSDTGYYIGVVTSNIENDVKGLNKIITITDTNNFTFDGNSSYINGYLGKHEPYKCGSNLYANYFGSKWGTKGLPPLTAKEIYKLIFDLDYIPGMETNNAMFKKWGTAYNNEMYFDENRKIN